MDKEKLITVFTPTYNRADTLVRTYESLKRQTSSNFEWLIIDDGSTDNTKELVSDWLDNSSFKIRYIHKENGGLHTGYNVAIQNTHTELCICCDSDDYLPDNAIELITDTWERSGNPTIAGIIGLDFDARTGKPIGGFFPETDKTFHFLEISSKLNHHGDTKMVLRTELLKPHVPMPSFKGEKNFNPIYIFMKVDPALEYIILNENLCNVDYQPTGMSANILYQFRNSPHSFAEIRKVLLAHPRISLSRKFIDAAHLVSSMLLAKDISILKGCPKKWLVALSFPTGLAFFSYIRYKTRKRK